MDNLSNNRRDFIKKSALAATALSLPTMGFNFITRPILDEKVIGHGKFKYRVHKSWGNLDPNSTPVKNCHEMVQDSQGRLLMITDEVKNNIIIYDKSGKLLDTWGTEFSVGHGLTLFDEGGEDVLFICDPSKENPRVVKTTIDGKIVMELPDPRELGLYNNGDPYRPTESAVAPNGEIFYVSDGYGSQWILQFDNKGEFIRKFGGKGDADSQFSTAHGVTIDARDHSNPTLLCTSRGHNAFKRFTLQGQYLSTIFLPGAFVCRAVIDDQNIYSGVCWSRLKYLNQTPDSGFVTILNQDHHVISNPGGTKPEYKKGKLQLMIQDDPVFKHCHDVCVDEDKNLYVCQWNAGKSYPIKLERI